MANNKEIAYQFLISVGDNIRRQRKKNNLSLEKLGLEVGLSRMDVHRIEKGANITLTTLLKISIALNSEACDLLRTKVKFTQEVLEDLVNISKSARTKPGLKS